MEKIEDKIQKKFIELLKTNEISDIDVSLISSSLGITRQSFYYHYKNIYDLVFSIYINKENKINTSSLKEIITSLLNILEKDRWFNLKVLASDISDALKDYTYSYLLTSYSSYLVKYNLKSEENRLISRFLASSINEEIINEYSLNYDINLINKNINKLINDELIRTLIKNIKHS